MNKQQSNILPQQPPEAAGKGCCPQCCDNPEQTSSSNLFPRKACLLLVSNLLKAHPGALAALEPVSGSPAK